MYLNLAENYMGKEIKAWPSNLFVKKFHYHQLHGSKSFNDWAQMWGVCQIKCKSDYLNYDTTHGLLACFPSAIPRGHIMYLPCNDRVV